MNTHRCEKFPHTRDGIDYVGIEQMAAGNWNLWICKGPTFDVVACPFCGWLLDAAPTPSMPSPRPDRLRALCTCGHIQGAHFEDRQFCYVAIGAGPQCGCLLFVPRTGGDG